MPDPYDYSTTFAGLPSPNAAFLQGVQGGAAIQQLQFERQQQQAALAQQQQKKAVLSDLVAKGPNATADDYVKAGLQVPELSAQFKQFWDMKNAAQQQSELQRMSGWAAAIDSGQPKIASDAMRAQADAIENTAGVPTPESKGLRAKADQVDANPQVANAILKSMIAANPLGAKAIDGITALNKDQREQALAPAAVDEAKAKAAGAQADATTRNLGIVASAAGALAKPGVKPSQAMSMFRAMAAQGSLSKDQAQAYIDGIPADPKALPDYLKQVQASGMKPDDQMKFTTPTADAKLQSDTNRRSQDITARTAADRLQFDKNNAEDTPFTTELSKLYDEGSPEYKTALTQHLNKLSGTNVGAVDQKQVENVAQLIASGRMAPLGAMAMRTPYGQAVMSRVAEINPSYRAQDFGTSSKAEKDFATGKLGSSVRSFNVGLSHLDTLGQLADAMGNKDTQAINRIGNYFATQTGSDAPVKFEAAKKVVTDEIVKAIVGAGGTGHDREEAAKTVSAASSPAQLRGVINTYKDLMVGQLGGLEQQYRTTTGRDDFHKYLSPAAQALYGKHSGTGAPAAAGPAPTLPAGWSVQVH